MQIKEKKEIYKNILFTIAYYNALDYLPTTFYIWKHLISVSGDGCKIDLSEIVQALAYLQKKQKIIESNGFWQLNIFKDVFLNEREYKKFQERVKLQIQKNKISTTKLQKARKWLKVIDWLPYLKGMIFMGTLTMKRGGVDSDWDVLIVIKNDRIWLGRLILTSWLQLLGKRRYGNNIQDKFCLNQFFTENSLRFQEHSEFAGNEILFSKYFGSQQNIHRNLLKSNLFWIKKIKPNFILRDFDVGDNVSDLQNKFKIFFESLLEVFGLAELLNKISKKIMIRKIVSNPKTYTRQADIRYGDFFLIFLPYPQRDIVKSKAIQLLTKMS